MEHYNTIKDIVNSICKMVIGGKVSPGGFDQPDHVFSVSPDLTGYANWTLTDNGLRAVEIMLNNFTQNCKMLSTYSTTP